MNSLRDLPIFGTEARFRRKIRGFIARDTSIVSSNCIGGRLAQIARYPYNSPTVGLWMEPPDFLELVRDLRDIIEEDIVEDISASDSFGYPVGLIRGLRLYFQHYASFEQAIFDWRRRATRLNFDDVVVTFTDRDGASTKDLKSFEDLPYRKIAFTANPFGCSAVVVPQYQGMPCVGDLYSDWRSLDTALSKQNLNRLLR